jgi:subtilase family serine protease
MDYKKVIPLLIKGIPIVTTVQNYGNVPVEKTVLGYYLSLDENFTTDDYLIAEKTIRNLDPSELRTIDKKVRVPLSVPPGWYEIGWILDPNDEIDELFEDNNVYFNGLKIHVVSTIFDQIVSDPLWLSLVIVGIVATIAVPTVIAIVIRKKRKK